MTDHSPSRRDFLAALGVASASALLPHTLWALDAAGPRTLRGLALAADDFAFEPGLIYLQTGSLGPTPRPVMDRAIAAWKDLELNPSAKGYGALEHEMEVVRAAAAQFIGCGTEEVVLTNCTSEGMNWTAQGIAWGAGDRVLTTDQEHPGGRVCWDYVARRHGVALDIVPIPHGENDAQAIIDRFERAITPRTRVLSFSHILSSTGLLMPVAELSRLARSRGCIAVVDGAQALGAMPVNVKTLGCHVYATSGHKWLLGPKGTGLLYLSEELGNTVDPIALQGGRVSYSTSSGVTSIPSVIALGATFAYMTTIGLDRINAHNLALRNRLFAALRSVPKVQVVSAAPGPLATALLTFRLPGNFESRAFQTTMRDKHHMELKVVPKNWMNGIRVSTHLFNTESEVDALVTALGTELA